MANIVLADDHVLLRNGLATLLKNLGHKVLFEACNGKELIACLEPEKLPDIVLMDINMPEMDGYETTHWLKINHPAIKVLALSMYDNETAIIRMLKCGAKGYMLKDSDPAELKIAIQALLNKGFYQSELLSGKLINAMNTIDDGETNVKNVLHINEKEIEFLKYTCTELSYKEIAEKMNVSPRTVDHYRDTLFEKLQVKTRVGLVMYAIRNKIVGMK